MHEDTRELVRVVEGDPKAFKVLFDKYSERIYENCLRFTRSAELAKDLTQEIFTRIWVYRDKLAAVERFDDYLFVVARNVVRNELRKKILDVAGQSELTENMPDVSPSLLASIELKELESHIEAAVVQLPPQMQKVFRLSRYDGLSHDEIAERMNISRYTSKTYITRALDNIRNYLLEKNKPADGRHTLEQKFFHFFLILTYSLHF